MTVFVFYCNHILSLLSSTHKLYAISFGSLVSEQRHAPI